MKKNMLFLVVGLCVSGAFAGGPRELIVYQKSGVKKTIATADMDSIKLIKNSLSPTNRIEDSLAQKKFFMKVYKKSLPNDSFVLANIDSMKIPFVGGKPFAYLNILNKKTYKVGDTIEFSYKLNPSASWVSPRHVLEISADPTSTASTNGGGWLQLYLPNNPAGGGVIPGNNEPQMYNSPSLTNATVVGNPSDSVYSFGLNQDCIWNKKTSVFTWKYKLVDPYKGSLSIVSTTVKIRVGSYDHYWEPENNALSEVFTVVP